MIGSPMIDSAWVVVPPLIVVILSIFFRRGTLALISGIILGALIASNLSLVPALHIIALRFFKTTGIYDIYYQTGMYTNLELFAFIILIGALIELIAYSGGLSQLTHVIKKHITTAKQAELTTLLLTFVFYLDPLFNVLTVGTLMGPIMDRVGVPRAKLAYVLSAMCSSLAVIIPLTSWTGVITTQLQSAGVSELTTGRVLLYADPYYLLIVSIPFIIYPLLSILNAFMLVFTQKSYGLMTNYETIAHKTGNMYGGKKPLTAAISYSTKPGTLTDIVLPLGVFLVVCIAMLMYTGRSWLLGGPHSLLDTIIHANSIKALFIASAAGVITAGFNLVVNNQGNLMTVIECIKRGFARMQVPILILLLSWTFALIMEHDLHTGAYIAAQLFGVVSLSMVPLLFFGVSVLVCAATGSPWATLIMLTPLCLPLLASLLGAAPLEPSMLTACAPAVGALIGGTIAGTHFSPIAGITILCSTSTQSYHLDHTRTLAEYSLPPLIGCLVGLVVIGQLQGYGYSTLCLITLITSSISMLVTLFTLSRRLTN